MSRAMKDAWRWLVLVLMFLHDKGVASTVCSSPPCLFYSNGTSISSLEIPSFKRTVVVRNLVNVASVDVHIKKNLLFWTERGGRAIRRVNLNSGKIDEVITKKVGEVGGLSVEWESGLLYWTDVKKKRLEAAHLDGSSRRILFDKGVARPRAIAVDPRKGLLFWTVEGTKAQIERSYLSGEKRKTIVSLIHSHQHWPNQIIIDFEEERIYWIDAFWDTIESVDYDGEDRERVKTGQGVNHPLGLTILDRILYWTDSRGSRFEETLSEVDNFHTRDHTMDNGGMGGLALIDYSRQPRGKDVCRNQGPCSHLCLLTPNGYRCACPTGVEIQEDGKTCDERVVDDLLLVTSFAKRKIYQVTLDEDNPQMSPLNLKRDIRRPLALAFDPKDEMVYWTDVALRRISRAYLDGEDQEVIIEDKLLSPEGLAVDTVARNLYWTDYKAGRIEVSRLDGSNRKVLISKDLKKPLDIVLDIQRGIMYWLSAGANPAIERANMDGTNRQIVTYFPRSLASHVPSPHGLALDSAGNKLYCTDANLGRLQFINLNNARPKFTTVVSHDDYMRRPYGMAVDTSYVYWTDTKQGALYRADKTTGGGVERLGAVEAPRDVLVYYRPEVSTVPGQNNTCAQDNGGCTHLCLLTPGGHHCACPADLPNGDSCLASPTTDSAPDKSPSTHIVPLPSAIYKEESLGTSEPAEGNSRVSPSGSYTEEIMEVATPIVATSSCSQTTCLHGGWCSETGTSGRGPCFCPPDYALEHCQLFIGAEKIKITFVMENDEWNKELFQKSLSEALTEYCAGGTPVCQLNNGQVFSGQESPETSTANDRSADDVIFAPDDVVVPQRPNEVGDKIFEVEAAVLRPLNHNTATPALVSGRVLCQIVKFSADGIGERFGRHRIVLINGEKNPSCDEATIMGETSELRKQDEAIISTFTGGIIGAIVAVVILVIIIIVTAIALLVGCKRGGFRQTTILPKFIRNPEYEYKKLSQENETSHANNNPPTYEEITPNLLSSIKKAAAKEGKSPANDPFRSTQNVYSEPTKCTPRSQQEKEEPNEDSDHKMAADVDTGEDETDGASSVACEGENSSEGPNNGDTDKSEREGSGEDK